MMPLGTYDDVSKLLSLSIRTLYRMVYSDELPAGIYLGRGRFNMDKIIKHIDDGTLFRPAPKTRKFAHSAATGNYKSLIRKEVEAFLK